MVFSLQVSSSPLLVLIEPLPGVDYINRSTINTIIYHSEWVTIGSSSSLLIVFLLRNRRLPSSILSFSSFSFSSSFSCADFPLIPSPIFRSLTVKIWLMEGGRGKGMRGKGMREGVEGGGSMGGGGYIWRVEVTHISLCSLNELLTEEGEGGRGRGRIKSLYSLFR